MKRLPIFALLTALVLTASLQTARAQVPARISFQSLSLDENGTALADGPYRVTFRLYADEQGGQALWSETQSVSVQEGLISTLVGAEKVLNLPFDQPYFLSVEVEGQTESQRMALSAAPYALVARDVPDSTVVRSISGIQDDVELVAGDGIAIKQQGNRLVISAAQGLTGYGPAETAAVASSSVKNPAKNGGLVLTEEEDMARVEELLATLGPGGSNVGLDAAYDAGRIITLDDGQVVLNGPGTGVGFNVRNTEMLFLNDTGANSTFRFFVTGASTPQTWRAEVVGTTGAFRLVNASSSNARPFVVNKTAKNNLLRLEGSALKLSNAAGETKVTIDTDVSGDGRVITQELEITGGSDLSENFEVSAGFGVAAPLPGMVVSIDPLHPGELTVSGVPYDRMVAGVVSGAGGIETGLIMGQQGSVADGSVPVALTGRVYVYVDASHGAVTPGDLLTTSSTAGHAMKVTDYARSQGAILGKAMTELKEGRGLVLMLVTLQ